jgi:hypothetical protein
MRGLIVTGLVAVVAAVVITTVAAAVAMAAGVDFEIPDGSEEAIPLSAFASVTACLSLAGVAIATVFRRRSTRPAQRFAWTAGVLTAISLVPPIFAGADASTTVTLVALHLVAASVMIPALARSLWTA